MVHKMMPKLFYGTKNGAQILPIYVMVPLWYAYYANCYTYCANFGPYDTHFGHYGSHFGTYGTNFDHYYTNLCCCGNNKLKK
jgi:hypothetical protein